MRRLLIVILLCFTPVLAVAGDFIVTLKNEPLNIGVVNFYVDDIIDSRANKDNIGTARTGAFNVESKVNLEGGFKPALMDFLKTSFPKDDEKTPIVLNVLNFSVNERMVFLAEKAEANADIEFYEKKDDNLIKLFKADTYVKQTSGVDCTKFHEQNIRNVLKEAFVLFISSSSEINSSKSDALVSAEELVKKSDEYTQRRKNEEIKTKPYYFEEWKKLKNYDLSYEWSRGALLFEYRYEKATGHYENATNSYCLGAGIYKTVNGKIDVKYQNGVKRTGKIDVNAIPVAFYLFHRVKTGGWSGKWGIGVAVYYFTGNIDMAPYDSIYDGSGIGANLVLPFEFLIYGNKKNDTFINLNINAQIPIIKNRFERANSYIEAPGYAGSFIGFSVGKYWK